MSDPDLFEQIRAYLPKYLTPENRRQLYEELDSFATKRPFPFYIRIPELKKHLLQGDAWQGFIVVDFKTAKRRNVTGVILSNSCDIDPKNPRGLTPNILFSPLIRLERYRELLNAAGMQKPKIESQFEAIRDQRVTQIFCLPPDPSGSFDESIVLLDNIHAHPLDEFLSSEHENIFSLSQTAFYLLLLKLSIHFSRFQENISRFVTTNAT